MINPERVHRAVIVIARQSTIISRYAYNIIIPDSYIGEKMRKKKILLQIVVTDVNGQCTRRPVNITRVTRNIPASGWGRGKGKKVFKNIFRIVCVKQ